MATTSAGAFLLTIAREAGMTDYDVISGAPATSKLARLRAPNGVPLVIQTNNKNPRIWVRPEHETAALARLGKREFYEAARPRHHHLNQVREFVRQPIVKIAVATQSRAEIRAAFDSIGPCRGTASL